ncbi:MAG TPA: hypothetical protein VE988_13620 [Gemmataceae bacterium]|nr:hypothetical protein [Gemmataceae bacterium]
MAANPQPCKPRRWLLTFLQVTLVIALLVTTMGASGIFAFIVCPGCSPMRVPDYAPAPPPTATEVDKDKKGSQ